MAKFNKNFIQIIFSLIILIVGLALVGFVAWWSGGASTTDAVNIDQSIRKGLGTTSFFSLISLALFVISFIILFLTKTKK